MNLIWYPAQLAVLAKVVDLNGFSAAARALDVPKAAVSRAIADLEKALTLSERRDADYLAALAEAYAAANRRADALKTAREAAALRPKDRLLAELVERLAREA